MIGPPCLERGRRGRRVERRQRRLELLDQARRGGARACWKFGTSSNWSTSLSSSAVSISSTLSSSATMSRRISGESAGRKTSARAERLAHLDRGLAAGGPAERRQPAGQRHLRLELGVDAATASAAGQSARCTDSSSAAPVRWRHMVSDDERAERRQQQRQRGQHRVQRRLRGQGVAGGRVGVGAPEAAAAAAHVPVGEVVDEVGQGGRRRQAARTSSSASVTAAVVLARRDRIQRSSGPRSAGAGIGGIGRVELVQRRVGREEAERVPQREQHVPHGGVDGAERRPGRRPGRALAEHPPAHGVGAPGVEDRPGVDDVAERLGHLAAVGVDDVAEAHDVAVRALAEDQRVDGQQRVEPAPGLVDGLGDEVGREGEGLGRARARAG